MGIKRKTILALTIFFLSKQFLMSSTIKLKLVITTSPHHAEASVTAMDKNRRIIRYETQQTPCLFEFDLLPISEGPLSIDLKIEKENYSNEEDQFDLDKPITKRNYSLHQLVIPPPVPFKPKNNMQPAVISKRLEKVVFGPTLGLSLAKQCEEGVQNSFKMGFALGGLMTYKLSDEFSLIGQFLFVQKGYKYSPANYHNIYEYNLTLNYLELPILARYSFGSDNLRYFLFAGPALAFKIKGNYNWKHNGEYVEGPDLSHKGMDFGLKFGGGFGYPLGSNWLMCELGITLGLLHTLDYATNTNAAILFMLSYLFGRF